VRRFGSPLARLTLLSLPLLAVASCHPASRASELPPSLQKFLDSRAEIASRLVEPIAACVRRSDSRHAVFSGCVDWHSSVHGLWALTAYTRAFDSKRFRVLIEESLSADGLEEEREYLRRHPQFEMPYGRSWFLRLAIEHRATFESDLLAPFAREVADSLVRHYEENSPEPASRSYDSASWALANLYDYAASVADEALRARVSRLISDSFVLPAERCPVADQEPAWTSFMAVCTNWAATALRVLDSSAGATWVRGFLPASALPSPVLEPKTAHHYGTNFSRAWGLWRIYWATRDRAYLDSYLLHFETSFSHPDGWRGDYRAVGHWVAQFGMFALMASYDDVPSPMESSLR
jgi:hypothetical protein